MQAFVGLSAEVIADRIGSKSCALIKWQSLTGTSNCLFARTVLLMLSRVPWLDHRGVCGPQRVSLLSPGNHEHDLAFRRVVLVMCKEFTCTAPPEFLEFLCQLSRDAKPAILDDIDTGGECFS